MQEPEHLEAFVRAGLALRGVAVDKVDLAVIEAVVAAYGPGTDALLNADLSGITPERDFDPGRAPTDFDSRRIR